VARPKVYFWVFSEQNSAEELNISRENTRAKKAGNQKISDKETQVHLIFDSGGLCYEETHCKGGESRQNYVKKKYKEQILSIFLSLYPKILAIASGATTIGSAVAHPIERSQQERT
jgi:hypothetical protein